MITGKLAVALIALIAVGLARTVSGWIGRSGREAAAEAGSGDAPGSRDRGPGGMKM